MLDISPFLLPVVSVCITWNRLSIPFQQHIICISSCFIFFSPLSRVLWSLKSIDLQSSILTRLVLFLAMRLCWQMPRFNHAFGNVLIKKTARLLSFIMMKNFARCSPNPVNQVRFNHLEMLVQAPFATEKTRVR